MQVAEAGGKTWTLSAGRLHVCGGENWVVSVRLQGGPTGSTEPGRAMHYAGPAPCFPQECWPVPLLPNPHLAHLWNEDHESSTLGGTPGKSM